MARKAQIDAVRPVLETMDKELTKIEGALNALDKVADKGTNVVESGLEKVADVVPEALDTAVHVSTEGGRKVVGFFRDPKKVFITAVVLSATAGAALGVAGYFALKKNLEAKLRKENEARLEAEIADIRAFYAKRNKEGQFGTPQAAVEALLTKEAAEALKSYSGETIEVGADQTVIELNSDEAGTDVPSAEQIKALREKLSGVTPTRVEATGSNIFVNGRDVQEFDYEAEVLNRNTDEPYVITHDEYMENEREWPQVTLTYYNGDDTLADPSDMPIPDIEENVGSENLTKFGYGSKDSNVVYVANEKSEMLYEINLSEGSFGEMVTATTELQHSAPLRKFRRGDDE